MKKDTLGCFSSIIILGVLVGVFQMTNAFWIIIAFIFLLISLVIWRKVKNQKASLDLEKTRRWPLDNLDLVEQAIHLHLKTAKEYQEELIENPQFSKGLPKKKKIIYQDLDERYAYFKEIERDLCRMFNQNVIPYCSSLVSVHSFNELNHALINMISSSKAQLAGTIKRNPYDSAGTAILKLFEKYGVDHKKIREMIDRLELELLPLFKTMLNDLKHEKEIISRGIAGEKKVKEELDLYRDIWKTLYNVRIETENTSVESDAIILSTKGVFSLEAKNYGSSGNYSIRVTKDGQWQKILTNGDIEPMKDVASQVNRHIGIKQRFINQTLKETGFLSSYVYIEPIIVIANDSVSITNESSQIILRASQVYQHIQDRKEILTMHQLDAIESILSIHNKAAKKFPHINYVSHLEMWLNYTIPIFILSEKIGNVFSAYDSLLKEYKIHSPYSNNSSIVLQE